jgi:hypothetical protein
MVCTSCNIRNRSVASCETGIDGRMLNNMSRGSSRENQDLPQTGCAQFQVHERRCTQILLAVAELFNRSRHNNRSNEEAAEMCCSLASSVRLSLGVDWTTCLPKATDEFRVAVTDQHTG